MNFDLSPATAADLANQYGLPALTALIILVVGWIASSWVSSVVLKYLPHSRAFDETIAPLLGQLVRYGILVVAIIAALNQVGVETTSVLAVLAAAGLAVALALQNTLSNLAAGVMLLWQRPFSVGDYVEAASIDGTVRQVGLFATRFRRLDGVYIFVPNALVWESVITNYNRERTRRVELNLGIAYEADFDTARTILLDLAAETPEVLKTPAPIVYMSALGDSAINVMFRAWTKTEDYWETFMALNEKAKKLFDQNGIDIPYPHVRLIAPEMERAVRPDRDDS